jgi:quercetin dioxygenase-like cupin family protein
MSSIRQMSRLRHETLDGTEVFVMDSQAEAGVPQEVLVKCRPHATIERHTHSVDAEMFIVGGSARVLSSDPRIHGSVVTPGQVVFFEKNVPHGFEALDGGLVFVSRNGGIVDETKPWDMHFDAPRSPASTSPG